MFDAPDPKGATGIAEAGAAESAAPPRAAERPPLSAAQPFNNLLTAVRQKPRDIPTTKSCPIAVSRGDDKK
jgi:hypothetical protein